MRPYGCAAEDSLTRSHASGWREQSHQPDAARTMDKPFAIFTAFLAISLNLYRKATA